MASEFTISDSRVVESSSVDTSSTSSMSHEHESVGDKYADILSQLVFYRTYSKTLESGKKETYKDTVNRVAEMHIEKFPHFKSEIKDAFDVVHAKKVVPSMRSMQFSGEPIKRSNSRIFNCSFVTITSAKDIADLFFKLMNGCGVGYSVQKRHISHLPSIPEGTSAMVIIDDRKEAWANSIVELMKNPKVTFDYSNIRLKGAPLSTGGTASGPEPLYEAHEKVRKILKDNIGKKLRSFHVHEIVTLVSDCVVVGGVRRAALISLFDFDDEEMLTCKHGDWWKTRPHLARSNNSAVIHRQDPNFETKVRIVMQRCFDSNAGEPGIILTNDFDYGFNPCVEASLKDKEQCNLSELNVSDCSLQEFREAAQAGATIGTLQASYTNFNYVQPAWKENCDKAALLGVSLTGLADNWGLVEDPAVLQQGARILRDTNSMWAKKLGINEAARIGCVKPSGSTSAFLNTSSGIHAAHSAFYLRRVRVDKIDPISTYLISLFGLEAANSGNILEMDAEKPDQNIVVALPIKKSKAIVRSEETAIDIMNRSKHIAQNWILPSHRSGPNHHNVSLTVSYKEHEKEEIIRWILDNAESFGGVSFLPHDGGNYVQAPFETISENEYRAWTRKFPSYFNVDFSTIDFSHTIDKRQEEAACAGGLCTII